MRGISIVCCEEQLRCCRNFIEKKGTTKSEITAVEEEKAFEPSEAWKNVNKTMQNSGS